VIFKLSYEAAVHNRFWIYRTTEHRLLVSIQLSYKYMSTADISHIFSLAVSQRLI